MLTLVHPNEFELPRGPLGVASASTAGAPWWPPVGGTRGLGRFLPSHMTRVGVQGPWAPLVSWHRSIRADAGVLARAALCGRVPTGLEVSGAHTRGLLRCGSQVCVLPHHLKASLVSVTWSRPKSELSARLWERRQDCGGREQAGSLSGKPRMLAFGSGEFPVRAVILPECRQRREFCSYTG